MIRAVEQSAYPAAIEKCEAKLFRIVTFLDAVWRCLPLGRDLNCGEVAAASIRPPLAAEIFRKSSANLRFPLGASNEAPIYTKKGCPANRRGEPKILSTDS